MSNTVYMKLELRPDMTIEQLCAMLCINFEKTGSRVADFDIPGADGHQQFLLNFKINRIDINERKH